MSACCSPSADHGAAQAGVAAGTELPFTRPERDPREVARGMVRIRADEFRMGGDDPDANPGDGEGPVRTVRLSPYLIDATAVTNRQFAAFVKATGYTTDAERFGWSFVFHVFVGRQQRPHVIDGHVPDAPWWLAVNGASWRVPEDRAPASTPARSIRSSTSPGATRPPTPPGRAGGCPRRPSGSTPHAAASTRPLRLGRGADPQEAVALQHLAEGVPHPQHR